MGLKEGYKERMLLVSALPYRDYPALSRKSMTHEEIKTQEEAGRFCSAPSVEAAQENKNEPGAAGAGPVNDELDWARRHVPDDPATLLVERKTEIIGWGVPAHKRERHLTAEVMVERVVIPVIERMQGRLLAKIEALDARIDALELLYGARKEKKRPRADERGGTE